MQTQQNMNELEVYNCTFQFNMVEATMVIKFPCAYSIEIKSMNNKITMATTKNKVGAVNSTATFNQILRFETDLLYNIKRKQFLKKQILIILNLISTRRPDQLKLVGRVSVDLSEIVNSLHQNQPKSHKLDYCSVNATVTFGTKFIGKKLSSTPPENFDKDSFSDFESFVAGIHNIKQSQPKQRSFEQSQKTVEMQWKNKTTDGLDKNKIIQQSLNQDTQSKITGRNSHKAIGTNQNINIKSNTQQPTNQQFYMSKLSMSDENSPGHVAKNQYLNSNSPILQGRHEQLYINQQQIGNRVRPDVPSDRSYGRKQLYMNQQIPTQIYSQPINQYEEILRSNHSQQKRIWDEQKRLLNEQIIREKHQNSKLKQRNQVLDKKLYETELKLCNIQGKIQNSKRQMTILQRQKDLEIKELKSRIQRITKQKAQKTQHLQLKQTQYKQLKQRMRVQQAQKRRQVQQDHKQNTRLQQKIESISKKSLNFEEEVQRLRKQLQSIVNSRNETEQKFKLENKNLKEEVLNYKEKLQNQSAKNKQEKLDLYNEISIVNQRYEEQIKKMIQQSNNLKNQLTLKDNEISSLKIYQQEVIQLGQNIEQLHKQLFQSEQKYNEVLSQVQAKNIQLNNIQAQHSKQIDLIRQERQKLMVQCSQLKQQAKKSQETINQLTVKLAQLDKNHRQYSQNLQKQILETYEQQSRKQEQGKRLQQQMQELKKDLIQMKSYQRGLEEELLNMANNQANSKELQDKFDQLVQKQHKLSQQFEVYQREANQRIDSLQSIIQQLNQVINSRNQQIQSLSKQKNQIKMHSLKLQEELAKKNTSVSYDNKQRPGSLSNSSVGKAAQQLKNLQKQLQDSKEEAQNKETQLQKLKAANKSLKQYQNGLEQQILRLNQQVETYRSKQNQKSGNEAVIQLEQKVKRLQQQIKQKNEYQIQLERQILEDHQVIQSKKKEVAKPNTTGQQQENRHKDQELAKKIGQLQQTIQNLRQYQQSLQQKILQDYDELAKQRALRQTLQATLSNNSKTGIQNNQSQQKYIKNNPSEISGEQSEIHKSCRQQKQLLYNIISQLQSNLLKISQASPFKREDEDYLMLQRQLDKKQQYINQLENQLLKNRNQPSNEKSKGQIKINLFNHQDQNVEEEQANQQDFNLAFNTVIRIIQAPSQHNSDAQKDQQSHGKQDFIKQQQAFAVKQQRKPVQKKSSIISQQPVLLNRNNKQQDEFGEKDTQFQKGNYNAGSLGSFVGYESQESPRKQIQMIISEQHIQQSNQKQRKVQVKKDSKKVNKAEIEQKQQKEKAKRQDKQMRKSSPDQLIKFIKQKQTEIQNLKNLVQSMKKQHKQQENTADLNKRLKQLQKQRQKWLKTNKDCQIKIKYLQTKNKSLQQRLKTQQHNRSRLNKANIGTDNKSIEHYHLQQLKQNQQIITKLIQQAQIYKQNIRLLQTLNNQYLNRINTLKSKEIKICEALAIIQEESQKIMAEMEEKQRQCQELRKQVVRVTSQLDLVNNMRSGGDVHEIKKSKVRENVSSLNQIDQISPITCYKQEQHPQQQLGIKQKVSIQSLSPSETSKNNKKYQQLLNQISEISKNNQVRQKNNRDLIENIRRLELQLKQVNEQLVVNKRLVTKLRQSNKEKDQQISKGKDHSDKGSNLNSAQLQTKISDLVKQNQQLKQEMEDQNRRISELQQQIFCYESNQNQNQMENQILKNEISSLRSQLQKFMAQSSNLRTPKSNKQEQNRNNLQMETKNSQLTKEVDRLQKQIDKTKKQAQQKTSTIKNSQNQLARMEGLVKAERLEYFNKRRQLTQLKQQADKIAQQRKLQLTQYQNQIRNNRQKQAQYEQNIKSLNQANANLFKQLDNLKIQKLTDELQKMKKQEWLAQLENQVSKQQEKIEQLQAQIIQLNSKLSQNSENTYKNTRQEQDRSQKQGKQRQLENQVQRLQTVNKMQSDKIQQAQKLIDELTYELQICQQQNQLNAEVLKKNRHQEASKPENNSTLRQLQQQVYKSEQRNRQLGDQLDKTTKQLQQLKQIYNQAQRQFDLKIKQLEQKLKKALNQKQKVLHQLEQKQMEHLNTELDLHFKIKEKQKEKEKSQKSQGHISSSLNEANSNNQLKKSFNASQQISINDLVPTTKILKQLIQNRAQKTLVQKQIEVMAGRIYQLQEKQYGLSSNTKQKGLILQKTRLLSMQFSKIKVQVMKSKINSEQRMRLLTSFKPLQNSIKEILKLSQIYSENLLSMDMGDSVNEAKI